MSRDRQRKLARAEPLLLLAVLVVLAAILYGRTLDYPFVFDDLACISGNPQLQVDSLDPGRLWRAARNDTAKNRPVANLTFALNWYAAGANPEAFRLVNIAIHILNAVLVYWFCRLTLARLPQKLPRGSLLAATAAVVWFVHPLQIQGVTYIVQRMTSLSAGLLLLSLDLYICGRGLNRGRAFAFAGSLLAWLLALGSKEIAVSLPFLVLLYEWYFFQHLSWPWLRRRALLLSVPLGVLVLAAFAFAGTTPWDRIMAAYETRDFSLAERVMTEWRVVIFYLSLLVLPLPSRLNLEHDIALSTSLLSPPTTLLSLLFIVGLMAGGVRLARRQPLLSFAIFWYFINLALESTIVPLELIFEHRMYLPSVAVVPAALYGLGRWLPREPPLRQGLALAVVAALSWGTFVRNGVWQDEVVMWQDAVAKSPGKPRLHCNLGRLLRERGDLAGARRHYDAALALDERYPLTHTNLAILLDQQGDREGALRHHLRAAELEPAIPEFHYNVAHEYSQLGRYEDAVAAYRRALALRPEYPNAHINLGNAYIRLREFSKARVHFAAAVKLMPEAAEAHNGLGAVCLYLGEYQQALPHFDRALQYDPGYLNARKNRQVAEEQLRRQQNVNPAAADPGELSDP